MEKKLYRSTRDRIFGGVCSGLSEYAQVEKGLLRFLTAVAIVVTGFLPGIIAYVVCVLVIPSEEAVLKDQMSYENEENFHPKTANSENTKIVIGVALILIGVIALAKLLFDWVDYRYAIPVVLVVVGSLLVYKNWRQGE
ncbi:MAG: PspC domain-containing protein [Clostridiaceae bacterium]|jgi:phage shock protein PspC (stress-responsive transcriptional regulator)|nr:PspC domain-containing protein [Clostridiaceae bacterium]